MGADQVKNIDAGMMEAAMGMQMVETVALLPHMRDTGFVGVSLYVDDQGMLKDLPHNPRAGQIAGARRTQRLRSALLCASP